MKTVKVSSLSPWIAVTKLAESSLSCHALMKYSLIAILAMSNLNCLSNDADTRHIVIICAQKKQKYQFGKTETNCLQSGGVRSVAFDVAKVVKGVCTNKTVVVSYFANSEPPSGIPTNALLVLEEPFFPYGLTGVGGERWVIGGDVYRGVFAVDVSSFSNVEHLTKTLTTPVSAQMSKEQAILLANGASKKDYKNRPTPSAVVEAAKRYAFGWLIQLATPPGEVHGYWIVVVGDDGVVKDIIGGL